MGWKMGSGKKLGKIYPQISYRKFEAPKMPIVRPNFKIGAKFFKNFWSSKIFKIFGPLYMRVLAKIFLGKFLKFPCRFLTRPAREFWGF